MISISPRVRARRWNGIVLFVLSVSACGGDSALPDAPPTVTPQGVATVQVTPATLVLRPGAPDQLTAKVFTASGAELHFRDITWTSSSDKVVLVSSSGQLFPVSNGTVTITATSEGKTGTATVTVVLAPIVSITVTPSTVPLYTGSTITLAVAMVDSTGRAALLVDRAYAWASSDTSIAAVSTCVTSCTLTGKRVGTATLTLNVEGKAATVTVIVRSRLSVVAGDAQSGLMLAFLPVAPSVKVVDGAGVPVANAPVTFLPSGTGFLATTDAFTDANGVASPGKWFLGEEAGDQTLTATSAGSSIVFHATAGGTLTYLTAVSVAAGRGFSCAVRAVLQRVSCWGMAGKNGISETTSLIKPNDITGGGFASVSASATHACALSVAGTAYCWGLNAYPTANMPNPVTPTLVPNSAFTAIVPSPGGNCSIVGGLQLYCWGDNSQYQLGDGSRTSRFAPTLVSLPIQFMRVSASATNACVLLGGTSTTPSQGPPRCWGANTAASLGMGDSLAVSLPADAIAPAFLRSIAVGDTATCGVGTVGISCWGGSFGLLPVYVITTATSGLAFRTISGDGNVFCALTTDGTAYCFGNNTYGALGDGTKISRATPKAVAGGLAFTDISANVEHVCGLLTDGRVACWGRNSDGELGNATVKERLTPYIVTLGATP